MARGPMRLDRCAGPILCVMLRMTGLVCHAKDFLFYPQEMKTYYKYTSTITDTINLRKINLVIVWELIRKGRVGLRGCYDIQKEKRMTP